MLKDATYWAEKIRRKQISTTELLTLIAEKIEQENPKWNALVEWDLEQAYAEARTLSWGEQAPFAGVPIPLKVLGQTKKGMLNTAGAKLFKGQRAAQTEYFVQNLEKAGFIPFGKTNAPEFGFKNITDPVLHGITKNPWNAAYHAGGSSGGAAAAVASGMFPLAGASDGGGSIRIPASFTGLVGLKPTRGSMPTGPGSYRGWQGASIQFALTKSMRDTQTLFESLWQQQKAAPYLAPDYRQQKQSVQKIYFTTESFVKTPVSAAAKAAVEGAVTFLTRKGYQVEEQPFPVDGVRLMQAYYVMNGAETAAMMYQIEQELGRPIEKTEVEPMTWAIYQYGRKLAASTYSLALETWDQAAAAMERAFETADLFLSPTTAETAIALDCELVDSRTQAQLLEAEHLSEQEAGELVYRMFERSLQATPFTQLANLTGQPAISLPTHLAENGLPLGIQFMASKGCEQQLFEMGHLFEQESRFYVPNAN